MIPSEDLVLQLRELSGCANLVSSYTSVHIHSSVLQSGAARSIFKILFIITDLVPRAPGFRTSSYSSQALRSTAIFGLFVSTQTLTDIGELKWQAKHRIFLSLLAEVMLSRSA